MSHSEKEKVEISTHIPVSPDHHVAMSEIHRRIAPSCVSPSANWHIALWPEPNFRANHRIDQQDRDRKIWMEKINQFIGQLEKVLTNGKSDGHLNISATDSEGDLRSALFISIHGSTKNVFFRWKVKVEVHFEYVTVSIFLKVSQSEHENMPYDSEDNFGIPDDDEEDDIRAEWPECLKDIAPERVSKSFDDVVKGDDECDLRNASHTLFDDVWNTLASEVVSRIDTEEPIFGYLFSDFRSVVIDLPSDKISTTLPFKVPTGANGDELISACEKTANALARIYRSMVGGVRRKEFVVCSMLDWRTVYISTLGARDDKQYRTNGEPNAVKFLLVNVVTPDKYQIGRLLERIHSIGVARLAALKNLERVRNIGRRVQAMGLELDEITKPEKPELRDIERFLVRLNNLGREGGADTTIDDGATYRISRSKFYTHIVETRLDDLRIQRIERWQPYDEVLRRRLFPAFKFIQDVGARIETLRGRVNSIILMIDTRISRELLETRNEEIKSQHKVEKIVNKLTLITVAIGVIQIIISLTQ